MIFTVCNSDLPGMKFILSLIAVTALLCPEATAIPQDQAGFHAGLLKIEKSMAQASGSVRRAR